MANIPNMSDGDVLDAAELFKIIGYDITQGSHAMNGDSTETEIGEVIVAANQASAAVIVIAAVRVEGVQNDGDPVTGTFKLRTGTSATATANTLRQTVVLACGEEDSGATARSQKSGGVLLYVITSSDETFTSEWQIHVTGTGDGEASNGNMYCDSMTVFGV